MTAQVSYPVLVTAGQVLARQEGHCLSIETFLRREGSIHDDTGLLLAMLAPPAWVALEMAAQITRLSGQIGATCAQQMTSTVTAYVGADQRAHEGFAGLAGRLGTDVPAWQDPRRGIAQLGPASGGAPSGYGDPARWFTGEVGTSLVSAVTGPALLLNLGISRAVADGIVASAASSVSQFSGVAGGLMGEASAWGSPAAPVVETDPTSYLVQPDLGRNEVDELRWSAGVVLGGIDWLAEEIVGFSILEEVVFKPFGGDWQSIKRASMAWGSAGAAFTAVGENFTGLTSSTMAGWQGEAGDAFRAVMAAAAGAFVAVSQAALFVSGVVANIAMVSQAACIAIGIILKKISEKLIRIAIEAAVPVAGWAAAAVETVIAIQDVIAGVRLAYTIIEGIVDAIDSFVGAQQQVVQSLGVIEDLAEYVARRAMA